MAKSRYSLSKMSYINDEKKTQKHFDFSVFYARNFWV